MRLGLLCLLVVAGWSTSVAQRIHWMTFEDAMAAQEIEQKKMVVDIYTKWCSWCKKMDESTFSNRYIVKYINENYYPVKFDAEYRKSITYLGETYEYVRNGEKGYHELAVVLAQGRLSFPTVVFLDEELSIIQALRGFQSSLRFEQIMTYFAQDYYKSTPWSKYCQNFHTVMSKH